MPRDLPTGTVTFLFTDIEGSTALIQSLGEEYVETLEAQQTIIRRALDDHGGIEIGTEGDAFFAVFESAVSAVRAAAAAQRELHDHVWPGGRNVRVRMGLHTGQGTLGGDDYVGLDVHRAARIAGAAHGGQVLVSASTRQLSERDVAGELGFTDLGEHRLKDLTHPERIHQVVISGLPQTFPPPASLTASARNLPTNLTSFVGRTSEIAEIGALIRQERFVTVAGPGGVGKTRLAIELGRAFVSEFADGIVFVPLAHAGGSVAAEAASALGLTEQANRPVEQTVADHLGPRSILLILDNCEHMRGQVAAFVGQVMKASPASNVLATSREPMAIAGEHVYRLGPLPVPASPSTDDSAIGLEVVRLFIDRARAASATFDPSGHVREILEICRKLEGIPLAIELAAARTTTLAVPQLLERLEDRMTVLARGPQGAISPHETLEAAIAWSHDLLTEDEARIFRRVAVFEGGFDADAAEAICSDGELPGGRILEALEGLIAKSLINVDTRGRRARYGMYEPIRRFASERLEESNESDAFAERHAAYFLEFAHARSAELRAAGQLMALDELEADHANLVAVLTRSWNRGDRETALDLAATLTWFWYLHAHLSEGELWSERLLADEGSPPSRSSVRLTIGAAEFDYRLGHHERAEERLSKAIAGARMVGSRSLEMWALSHRATNDLFQRSFESAAEQARASVAIAEEIGSIGAAAYGAYLLVGIEAESLLTSGELDRESAHRLHTELAPLAEAARGLGDRNMIGHVLQVAGFLSATADDELAWRELDEALTALGDLKNAACSAHCLEMVALAVASPDPKGAATLLSAASAVRRETGVTSPAIERYAADLAYRAVAQVLDADDLAAADRAGTDVTLAEAVAQGRSVLAKVAALDA